MSCTEWKSLFSSEELFIKRLLYVTMALLSRIIKKLYSPSVHCAVNESGKLFFKCEHLSIMLSIFSGFNFCLYSLEFQIDQKFLFKYSEVVAIKVRPFVVMVQSLSLSNSRGHDSQQVNVSFWREYHPTIQFCQIFYSIHGGLRIWRPVFVGLPFTAPLCTLK